MACDQEKGKSSSLSLSAHKNQSGHIDPLPRLPNIPREQWSLSPSPSSPLPASDTRAQDPPHPAPHT